MKFEKPDPKSVIYENNRLCIFLASNPIAKGHTIVVWKKKVQDLQLLSRKNYEHLMDAVDMTRNALLKTLRLKKVYLLYADEVNQVHWHLVPRYNKKGYDILNHKPSRLKDFSLVSKIRRNLKSYF